jgi:hypothetical protein
MKWGKMDAHQCYRINEELTAATTFDISITKNVMPIFIVIIAAD